MFLFWIFFWGAVSDTTPYEMCKTDQNPVDQVHICTPKQTDKYTTFLSSFMINLNLTD